MADSIQSLSVEYVVSGLVGLITIGLIAKQVFAGYLEANKHLSKQSTNPIIQAMASTWDRDQQERFLQLMERLVVAEEIQAKHQGSLADQRQQDMAEKIDQLLEHMHDLPTPRKRT